ncbi:hypothetical protein GCM10023215_07530 [Pseudonocardia yuanmonensis]|uniref:Tripartite ATP-independent periplasmic transporters DctQ component domain-containing protein n=1 Tax=Pseudonocardia yuanmonensis TaxID=1095914 RepID=A0ABP8W0L8_9PSEU
MAAFDRVLTRVENVLAAGSLGLAALVAIVAVLLRTTTGQILFWSEEAVILLVITSTFLGAVVTLRYDEHVNVDLVALFLSERGKRVLALIGIAVTLVYLGIVGAFAWLVLAEPYARLTLTPALKLPLWLATLPVPVGFTLMFLRACEIASRMLSGRDPYPARTAEREAEEAAELEAEGAIGRPPDEGPTDDGPGRGEAGR